MERQVSENKWKTGDQVQLKSGGPVMTVTMEAECIPVGYLKPIGMIRCDWNVECNAYGNYYAPDAVEHAWLRSDPDKATRDRHVDGLSLDAEAEQTLLTAQTEIQTIEMHYKQSTIAKMATTLIGCVEVSRLCESVERLQVERSDYASVATTLRLILEAKHGESLNQAATRVRLELSEQSNRRTAAEGRLAEIKRALGNEGLLA
jgi:uncharacterized protein YodC (DUF2158 family)